MSYPILTSLATSWRHHRGLPLVSASTQHPLTARVAVGVPIYPHEPALTDEHLARENTVSRGHGRFFAAILADSSALVVVDRHTSRLPSAIPDDAGGRPGVVL